MTASSMQDPSAHNLLETEEEVAKILPEGGTMRTLLLDIYEIKQHLIRKVYLVIQTV